MTTKQRNLSLPELIDRAREWRKTHPVTPEEHRAQCISFAYGNAHLANEDITQQMIEDAYDAEFKHKQGNR